MVVRNVVRSPVRAVVQSVFGEGESFHPFQLFTSGAQGAWYDPSDFSTLYQDAAGTTPVTAVEQPVRLMLDRSRGLVLGSELVTNGDFSDGTTGWTVGTNWAIGAGVASKTGGTAGDLDYSVSLTANRSYQITWTQTVTAGGFTPSIVGGGTGVFTNTSGLNVQTINSGAAPTAIRINGNTAGAGTIDNISVRELPGNHALAPNDASRPVLRSRYNLLTRTEEFDDAAWTLLVANTGAIPTRTANAGTDPLGGTTADRLQFSRTLSGAAERSSIQNGTATFVSGAQYTASFYAKSFSGGDQEINLTVNANGAVTQTFTATSSWQRFTYTFTSGATFTATGSAFRIGLIDAASSALTSDVLLWGAQLLTAADHAATGGAYQRVGSATDYDTGPPWRPYLAFDGSDDSMSTSSIDFSGTDKVAVFAGVTRASSTSTGILTELSTSVTTVNGSFAIVDRGLLDATTNGDYGVRSRGTTTVSVAGTTLTVPTTSVLTMLSDISAPSLSLAVNGAPYVSSTSTQGTGNFANAALFIGRRNNTSNPFNGRLTSLIVLGRTATAAEISATEAWVNGKTGAF